MQECKPAVKLFIRESSEGSLWSLSTHYRSRAAAAIIEREIGGPHSSIWSRSDYHAFCREKKNGLRHEHIVPCEAVYQLIVSHPRPSVLAFARILRRAAFRAIIAVDQDRQLSRAGFASSMPAGYNDPASHLYGNHLARYIEAGIVEDLESRPSQGWYEPRRRSRPRAAAYPISDTLE